MGVADYFGSFNWLIFFAFSIIWGFQVENKTDIQVDCFETIDKLLVNFIWKCPYKSVDCLESLNKIFSNYFHNYDGWNRWRAKSPKHLIRRLRRLEEVGSRSLDLLKNLRTREVFAKIAGKPVHTAHLVQSIENVIRCVSWFWIVGIKIFFSLDGTLRF